MGVHTGDSIVVAPAQTLTDREHQQLRSAALRIISALDIEGGCNVQFAMHPESHEYFVIEVNPRVSRSSALASKATGYPIARVAAKIAAGRRLDEIPNAVTGRTCAAFEPALDYCVVKIPRWPFDKFPDADRRLGTQMKSTGEVMAIERSFEAAFNKAIRSLEQRRPDAATLRDRVLVESPNDRRAFAVMEALRGGAAVDEVSRRSTIAPWFVRRLHTIVDCEERLRWGEPSTELLAEAKHLGIGDARIAELRGEEPVDVRARRESAGLRPVYKCVDTCAAEFEAQTPYYYSTYETEDEGRGESTDRECVVVLGSGPIRIGQGIEFDYCSVQAATALRDVGCRGRDDQQQPGDGEHRLRLQRQAVLRAARRGVGAERDRRRAPARGGRAVRRPDRRQPGAPAPRRRRDHPRQRRRHHRRRRGQAHLRGADALARDPAAARRRHHRPRRGHGDRRPHRLPGAGPPVVRARRPGHGGGAQPRRARALPRRGHGRAPRGRLAPARHRAGGQVPLRHRGRRRRHLRRRDRGGARAHGAHRARRRAQR